MEADASNLRYSRLRWNTPLSDAHAEVLLDRFELPAATILDLGCGWGELMVQTLVRSTADTARGAHAVGIDTDATLLDRGRRLAERRGIAPSVRFVQMSASDWREPADRVLCIGAAHAWGGTAAALQALPHVVNPQGLLLFGDGCWERPPTPAAAAMFSEVLPLTKVVSVARDAGWRVMHLSTASQHEWDDFESRHRAGSELSLRAETDTTVRDRARSALDARLSEYLDIYRGVLGFAYLVLAPA